MWMNLNKFTGTIPSEPGKLKELSLLYFDFNSFSGMIQSEIVSGTVPSIPCRSKELLELSLSSNVLTDTIPSDIGKLT
ncbi:hypothetical protein ACHAW6_000475 [Cyclotella cf. meneghiniana]